MLKGLSANYLLSVFILFCGVNSSFAGTVGESGPPSEFSPILTLTVGASIFNSGASRFFAPDRCSYRYEPHGSNSTSVLWGGFLGTEVKRFPSWAFISGLGYYQPGSIFRKGILTQG